MHLLDAASTQLVTMETQSDFTDVVQAPDNDGVWTEDGWEDIWDAATINPLGVAPVCHIQVVVDGILLSTENQIICGDRTENGPVDPRGREYKPSRGVFYPTHIDFNGAGNEGADMTETPEQYQRRRARAANGNNVNAEPVDNVNAAPMYESQESDGDASSDSSSDRSFEEHWGGGPMSMGSRICTRCLGCRV
jgi:hypothetical protein